MQPYQNRELVANSTWSGFALEGATQQLEPRKQLPMAFPVDWKWPHQHVKLQCRWLPT